MSQSHTSAYELLGAMPNAGASFGRGRGGEGSDPDRSAWSDGELVIPADDVRAYGAAQILAMVGKNARGARRPPVKDGRVYAADGGLIEDPSAVTRVGNSYSGGNVSGSITVNGQAPGGTFSSISAGGAAAQLAAPAATAAQPAPAAAPAAAPAPWNPASGVGRPNVLGSLADTNAQLASFQPTAAPKPTAAPASGTAPAAAAVTPAAAPKQPEQDLNAYANRNDAFNAGAVARSQAASQPRQAYGLQRTFRDGGVVMGPGTGTSDSIPAMLSHGEVVMPADTVQKVGAAKLLATIDATHVPKGTPAWKNARQAFAEGGFADEDTMRGAVMGDSATRTIDPNEQPLGIVGATSPAAAAFARTPSASPAAAPAPAELSSMADTQTRLANLQTSNAAVQRGGVGIIADPDAQRRADFFKDAEQRNELRRAQSTWSPRRGYDSAAIAQAQGAIDNTQASRAQLALGTMKDQGDTQRALAAEAGQNERASQRDAGDTLRTNLQERGIDARAMLADTRQFKANQVAQERLRLDQARAAREATSAGLDQAAKQRTAMLENQVLTGTPEERQAASQKIAAIAGKDVTGGGGKPMPASAAKGHLENQSNLRLAENALGLLNGKTVDGVQGDAKAVGLANAAVPNKILNWVDPKGVDTRAAIANLGSMVIHDRSGAAVTAAEMPRLQPFIPTDSDDPATARKKLEGFVRNYRAVVDDSTNFYKEMGYKVPSEVLKGGGADGAGAPNEQGRGGAGASSVPPQVLELQRRAASNPAIAQRLKQMGY